MSDRISATERLEREATEQENEAEEKLTVKEKEDANKTHSERMLEKSIGELYSKTLLEMKTDLSSEQIVSISRGKIFAERFKSSAMEDLIVNIMELSVSKGREGRKEMTNVMRASGRDIELENRSNPLENLFRFNNE